MEQEYAEKLKGKRIGLITNHTAVNGKMMSTADVFKKHADGKGYKLVALFAPEHGMNGTSYAEEMVEESKDVDGIPIYSLHGKTRRPTDVMLKEINLLVFDIQDIGSRSYTYISTLFYVMEEASKRKIPIVVLDRPNPITGLVVDGPLLEEKWRSFIGYINVPYCHGMTVGELARYFNSEYKIGCELEVVPMQGWRRWMSFQDTALPWIPTSPYIPESNTPFFYPTTGILGTLQLVNIGIGYTLPFKVVGAPWINAKLFAKSLNAQKFPGVHFEPFYYRPFYGRFAKQDCQGVLIVITEQVKFRPVTTQYLIIGILKSLYPKQFQDAIAAAKANKETICKVNGTEEVYRLITEEKNIVWKLHDVHLQERGAFLVLRKKYLISEYSDNSKP
ncbi:MAG: DUF1343 domain-containing protein [Parachlamydiaceae bacterium]|nr:DUF1343 domain-containing protein [Parachlamydiaceae bacterium]